MFSSKTTCIHDMYGCKTGSTIYLKVTTYSDDVIWKFNGEKVESKADLRKGFEKKNAVSSDTGKYICIVENEERYVFDVIVYENYDTFECSVREAINLKVHTDSEFAKWTLNGKDVKSECNVGFTRTKAEFEDSGRYECIVEDTVIHAFDVVVYELVMFPDFINFYVEDTDPSCTTWIVNGEYTNFRDMKRICSFYHYRSYEYFGRYLCKVNGSVKYAFYVIRNENVTCKIGSTIDLKVPSIQRFDPKWTLNGKAISFDCHVQKVLKKDNADFNDSGVYKWEPNGILKCIFNVAVYDEFVVEIGSNVYFEINSESTCPIWFLNGRNVESECDPKKGFEKKNAVQGDSGTYEGRVEGIVKYTFNVIIQEFVDVKIGSTLQLLEKTEYVSYWRFNGKDVSAFGEYLKGFKKSNVDYSDSGRYEYIHYGVKHIFDVVVFGSIERYECKFGSTIYLPVNSYSCCPKWTFNRQDISTECCPHKGFEKKDIDFSDTGIYRCKVGGNVTHVFEVIVYKYLFGAEFLGIRFTVPDEGFEEKPERNTKSENSQKETRQSETFSKDMTIEGISIMVHSEDLEEKPERNTNSEISQIETRQSETFSKDMTIEGISIMVHSEDSGEIPEKNTNSENSQSKTRQSETFSKDMTLEGISITVHSEDSEEKPERNTNSENSQSETRQSETFSKNMTIEGISITVHSEDSEEKPVSIPFPEYEMNRYPRGIAVIICIDKFERMNHLKGLKKDRDSCREVFDYLHFDVKICDDTKESDIDKFLTKIADNIQKGKEEYDCFMLLFGSHGGDGYVCCSDFNRSNETGFIHIHGLLKRFRTLTKLKGKPKIFFFDSCRQIEEKSLKHSELKRKSDIEAHSNETELAKDYGDILIGYGAIRGTAASGNMNGGFYTQQLTKSLKEFAKTVSFIELVTQVNDCVREEVKKNAQVTAIYTTLRHRIIMKHLNRRN